MENIKHIELGDSGEDSKDKINDNFDNLKASVDHIPLLQEQITDTESDVSALSGRVNNLENDVDVIVSNISDITSLGILKTYGSYAAMIQDLAQPVGDNGELIRRGQLVSVWGDANTSLNGIYALIEANGLLKWMKRGEIAIPSDMARTGGYDGSLKKLDDVKVNILDIPHTGGDTVYGNNDDLSTYTQNHSGDATLYIYGIGSAQIERECVLKSFTFRTDTRYAASIVVPQVVLIDGNGDYTVLHSYEQITAISSDVCTTEIKDDYMVPAGTYIGCSVSETLYCTGKEGVRTGLSRDGDPIIYMDNYAPAYSFVVNNEIKVAPDILTESKADEQLLPLLQSYGLEITPANFFARNVIKDGGKIDNSVIGPELKDINPFLISDASVVFIPGAYKSGVVYGLNPRTGEAVNFDFSRATSATYFDKNLDMHLVGADIPRVDYGNYSFDGKLLIEKYSTNLCANGNFINNSSWWATDVVAGKPKSVEVDWFDFFTTAALFDNQNNTIRSGVWRTVTPNAPLVKESIFLIRADGDKPNLTNGTPVGPTTDIQANSAQNMSIDDFANIFKATWTRNVGTGVLIGLVKYEDAYRASNKPVLVTGYQTELEDFTSYIPTTTAQVTRSSDNLSYTLEKACSVYLKTTKQNIVLDKAAGVWNIHDELNNEGILQLAIFDRILTDDERLLLIDKFENFHARLRELGIDLSVDSIRQYYNSLPTLTKENATAILFPIPGVEGKLLGMNNTNGGISEFTFARATSGTYFDKDFDIHLAAANMPRLDYGNYSNGAKILVEKASTNLTQNNQLTVQNALAMSGIPTANRILGQQDALGNNNGMLLTSIEGGNYVCWSNTTEAIFQGDGVTPCTRSLFVKANSNSKVQFELSGSIFNADLGQWTSLPTPSYTVFNRVDYGVLSLNNGWYYIWETIIWKYPVWDNHAMPFRVGDRNPQTDIYSYYICRPQAEIGVKTSLIPTSGSQVTRSSDNLSYTLEKACSVYLKTTKQNIVLDKPAGLWNIHDELNNEGILMINIFNRILTADEKAQLTA